MSGSSSVQARPRAATDVTRLRQAGVTSGYQRRPCLDPGDPQCPTTATNKASSLAPDIGAELTGGCYGFATKHMHWPEQLVVGGIEKNRTGHVVRWVMCDVRDVGVPGGAVLVE